MISAVGPEEFGEFRNLRHGRGVDSFGIGRDFFEQSFLPQPVGRQLVVKDGINSDGCLGEPIGERLLPGSERLKAGGVELDESRVPDALDDNFVGIICLAECWRGASEGGYENE